jgi:hypothetical protein
MARKQTTWIVDVGEGDTEEYPTKKEAEIAEAEYRIDKEIYTLTQIFRNYFKDFYDKGTGDRHNKYIHLCVD